MISYKSLFYILIFLPLLLFGSCKSSETKSTEKGWFSQAGSVGLKAYEEAMKDQSNYLADCTQGNSAKDKEFRYNGMYDGYLPGFRFTLIKEPTTGKLKAYYRYVDEVVAFKDCQPSSYLEQDSWVRFECHSDSRWALAKVSVSATKDSTINAPKINPSYPPKVIFYETDSDNVGKFQLSGGVDRCQVFKPAPATVSKK